MLRKKYYYLVLSMASLVMLAVTISGVLASLAQVSKSIFRKSETPKKSHSHDVAVDPVENGLERCTAQGTCELGKLAPDKGKVTHIKLGIASGPHMGASAPHGIVTIVTRHDRENDEQFMVRIDPETEKFEVIPLPSDDSNVHKINERPRDIWASEAGLDRIMVLRTGTGK